MRYTAVEEADITVERSAVVPEDIDRSRVRFLQVSCLAWVWPAVVLGADMWRHDAGGA